jgi:DNA-binding NtrC family response regulator
MARILVIDDSVSVLELVASILGQAGHEVIAADSGKRGAAILASEPLDLVITDIYMPDQDGLEVIRKVRRMRPGLRVLAMSSATGKYEILPVAKALGAAGTLLKPFAVGQLLDAVDTCLEGPAAPGGRQPGA